MRSEKEVYDIVLNFAKTDKRIRMVTLEGSRTNTNIPPDDFQDFDITFFVTDMDSFTSDDKWLDIFGERLILQKPEDMELFPAVEKGFSYLMLFTDDVKIDLTLLPLELIDEYFTWDKLVNWNYGDDCVMLMLCLRIACIHVLSVKALPEPSLEGSVNCTLLFYPCLTKGNDYG